MNKTFRTVTLCFCVMTFTHAAAQTDDAVWINQGIQAALAAGQSEYVLPAGVFNLRTEIRLPGGIRNFTLRGQGSEFTHLRTPDVTIGSAINVGEPLFTHNNWGVSNRPTVRIANVRTGDRTVQLQADMDVSVGRLFYIWDDHSVKHVNNPDRIMNRGELTRVVAYDPLTRVATLDLPAAREYTLNPKISFMQNAVAENLTFSGMSFNGRTTAGQFSSRLLSASLVDGLTVDDLQVNRYVSGGINLVGCRNVLITNVDVSDASEFTPGKGYGYTIARSRYVTIRDCSGQNNRHTFVMHAGTTDVLIERVSAPNGGIDTHGFDERRITIRNISSPDTRVGIGNEAWHGGAQEIVIEDSVFGRVTFGPNVRSALVNRSRIVGQVISHSHNASEYGPGYPTNVMISNSEIIWTSSLVQIGGRGHIAINRSNLITTQASWSHVLLTDPGSAGVLSVTNSRLFNGSTRWDTPVLVRSTNPAFRLSISNCTFEGAGTPLTAVHFDTGFAGSGLLLGNRFRTRNTGQIRFHSVRDASAVRRVRAQSNSAVRVN